MSVWLVNLGAVGLIVFIVWWFWGPKGTSINS